MPKISICNKTCIECGFLKCSKKGVLTPDFIQIANRQILFPCHMELKKVSGSENTGVEQMKDIKVCRGYIESFVKSGIKAKHEEMQKLMNQIEDVEKDIMNVTEALRYHGRII